MAKRHSEVKDDEVIVIPEPAEEQPVVNPLECPICKIGLKRSNCGSTYYCRHGIPMTAPCYECKKAYNNRIYWNCPKCNYLYADVPPAQDWRISNCPRKNKRFMIKLPEEQQ